MLITSFSPLNTSLCRYNPTADNLDIVELSAVYASLPSVFSNDTTGKKTELKTAIMHMLQRLMRERDEGTLASIKTRSPAYCDEEYGPVEDITSTYVIDQGLLCCMFEYYCSILLLHQEVLAFLPYNSK